jgi:hypothetical protein
MMAATIVGLWVFVFVFAILIATAVYVESRK